MTPEAQRIAIATACGWTDIGPAAHFGRAIIAGANPTSGTIDPLPDYLNDLNAMAEAEKLLDDGIMDAGSKRYTYARFLYNTLPPNQQPCRATAPQRAEALIRALDKWNDDL